VDRDKGIKTYKLATIYIYIYIYKLTSQRAIEIRNKKIVEGERGKVRGNIVLGLIQNTKHRVVSKVIIIYKYVC